MKICWIGDLKTLLLHLLENDSKKKWRIYTMIDLKNRYEVLIKKVQHLGNRITELEEENFKLKKDIPLMEEGLQAEILAKDKEIGRLMKKVNDKR